MPDHLNLTFTPDEIEAFELLADMVQDQINEDAGIRILEVRTLTTKTEATPCITNTINL